MLFHQCLVERRCATGCQRASPKRQASGFAHGGRNRPVPPYEPACGTIICGIAADFGQPGNPLVEAGQGLTSRGITVVFFHERTGCGSVYVSRQCNDDIGSAVIGLKPVVYIVQSGGIQVFHGADHRITIRMPGREYTPKRLVPRFPGRVDFHAGAFRFSPRCVVHRVSPGSITPSRCDMRSDSSPQHTFQGAGGYGLKIVGAIEIGGAVYRGCANFAEGLEVLIVIVLAALEHEVFEKMGQILSSPPVRPSNQHGTRWSWR